MELKAALNSITLSFLLPHATFKRDLVLPLNRFPALLPVLSMQRNETMSSLALKLITVFHDTRCTCSPSAQPRRISDPHTLE